MEVLLPSLTLQMVDMVVGIILQDAEMVDLAVALVMEMVDRTAEMV